MPSFRDRAEEYLREEERKARKTEYQAKYDEEERRKSRKSLLIAADVPRLVEQVLREAWNGLGVLKEHDEGYQIVFEYPVLATVYKTEAVYSQGYFGGPRTNDDINDSRGGPASDYVQHRTYTTEEKTTGRAVLDVSCVVGDDGCLTEVRLKDAHNLVYSDVFDPTSRILVSRVVSLPVSTEGLRKAVEDFLVQSTAERIKGQCLPEHLLVAGRIAVALAEKPMGIADIPSSLIGQRAAERGAERAKIATIRARDAAEQEQRRKEYESRRERQEQQDNLDRIRREQEEHELEEERERRRRLGWLGRLVEDWKRGK